MREIRAFVGRSFTAPDAEVTEKFLQFFTTMQGSIPGFKWKDARVAQPKDIAQKVKEILEDCTCVIAICTRKEAVIPIDKFKKQFFGSKIYVDDRDVKWKTSDWVIQEVSYAAARKLDLVILLENNVEPPGGIQGNVEYIPFDRQHPEMAFPRIMEMVAALTGGVTDSPPTLVAEATEAQSAKPADPKQADQGSASNAYDTPNNTWTAGDYEFGVFWNISFPDDKKLQNVIDSFQNSIYAKDPSAKASFDTYLELHRIRELGIGDIENIKTISRNHQSNSRVLDNLATAYRLYEKFQDSADTYLLAFAATSLETEKISFLQNAAIDYVKSGNLDKSWAVVEKITINQIVNEDIEYASLNALYAIFQEMKETKAFLAVSEKLIDMRPGNTEARFNIAYKYHEEKMPDLALYHYQKIPTASRSDTAWNNLGIVLGELDMAGKSISALEKAVQEGNSLAMGNLASRYLRAGFTAQAGKLLKEASEKSDYHELVNAVTAKLQSLPGREDKILTNLLSSTRSKSEFMRDLGRASSLKSPAIWGPVYAGGGYVLNISVNGRLFSARGTDTKPAGALSTAMFGSAAPKDIIVDVVIEGRTIGRSAQGIITRVVRGTERTSLLESSANANVISIYLSDDGESLNLIESIETQSPKAITLDLVPF